MVPDKIRFFQHKKGYGPYMKGVEVRGDTCSKVSTEELLTLDLSPYQIIELQFIGLLI